MGKKNKISQVTRRQIKSSVKSFVQEQFLVLDRVIKKRPKFVPLWIWSAGARIFIDTKKLRKYMETGVPPKSTDELD